MVMVVIGRRRFACRFRKRVELVVDRFPFCRAHLAVFVLAD
jgi:hypothetical protein